MNKRVGNRKSQIIFKRMEILMLFNELLFTKLINISSSAHGINVKFSGSSLQYLRQGLN